MTKYIYYSNQEQPELIIKKHIKRKKQRMLAAKYLERLKANNIDDIEALKKLASSGCTYAYLSNVLVESFIIALGGKYDDEIFTSTFGFSLLVDEETADSNILMTDIFSYLYNKVKMEIYSYQVYHYKNEMEALEKLFGEKAESEDDAILRLKEHKIYPDGKEESGINRYKTALPKIETIYGSYNEIARQLGIAQENVTKEELISLLKQKDITFAIKYEAPESKLSGLFETNINTWANYYLCEKNIDAYFKSTKIPIDFNTYAEFKEYLNNQMAEGYCLGISSSPNNKKAIILNPNNSKEAISISSKIKGHQMIITGFDQEDNIIINSWGKDFIIPKENYQEFVYTKGDIVYRNLQKKNTKVNNTK